jgi:hypothetical protein
MTKRISDQDVDTRLHVLFPVDDGLPCPEGTILLRAFAEARPGDFAFLKPADLSDLRNSAFAGIPEWEAFSEHYSSCELCNA